MDPGVITLQGTGVSYQEIGAEAGTSFESGADIWTIRAMIELDMN